MRKAKVNQTKFNAVLFTSAILSLNLIFNQGLNAYRAYAQDWQDRNYPEVFPATPPTIKVVVKWIFPETIEEKIKAVFGKDGDLALKVAMCESSLNAKAENPESSARGLFGIMQSWHKIDEKWLFIPEINIMVAHQLYKESGNSFLPHWEASRGCWSKQEK